MSLQLLNRWHDVPIYVSKYCPCCGKLGHHSTYRGDINLFCIVDTDTDSMVYVKGWKAGTTVIGRAVGHMVSDQITDITVAQGCYAYTTDVPNREVDNLGKFKVLYM